MTRTRYRMFHGEIPHFMTWTVVAWLPVFTRPEIWQNGSQPKEVHDNEMTLPKLEYMHNNPVKRGYLDEPTHWRYSSVREYAGVPGLIEVKTDW